VTHWNYWIFSRNIICGILGYYHCFFVTGMKHNIFFVIYRNYRIRWKELLCRYSNIHSGLWAHPQVKGTNFLICSMVECREEWTYRSICSQLRQHMDVVRQLHTTADVALGYTIRTHYTGDTAGRNFITRDTNIFLFEIPTSHHPPRRPVTIPTIFYLWTKLSRIPV
jgi:hypothetical protein